MSFFDKVLAKISDFVIKFRMPIVGIFISLALLGGVGIFVTKINSDVFSYLPPDSMSAEGMKFLEQNFGISGNAIVALDKNTEYASITDYVNQIEDIKGVSKVLWIGSLDKIEIAGIDFGKVALMEETREKAREVLMQNGNYLLMINMSVGASTNEAGQIIKGIDQILKGENYAMGGTAPVARKVYDDAMKELPIYLVIAVALVLIILFLTAQSYVEPLIFITTLGISVLINMGSNFIFGEISIITFAAAGLLQLGLAMDYAIFLTHMYSEEKQKVQDASSAVKNALKRTFPTVSASALTTMGGMAALFLMSFSIGRDLGGVLMKGIALSLITVIVLQPCLLVLLDKTLVKTQKKALDFKFDKLAKFTVKNRVVVIIIFCVLLIPAYLGQHFLDLSYLDFLPKTERQDELTQYVENMSNQLFVIVSIDSTDLLAQKEYVQKLKESEYIHSVTGLISMLPDNVVDSEGNATIFGLPITNVIYRMGENIGFVKNGYTMYTIALNSEIMPESSEANRALAEVHTINNECYEEYMLTGMVQGVKEFEEITPRDFLKINLLSIGLILLVLIINFRSIKYPLLLVLLIQFGIWLNLSINRLFGSSVNFLSYLVLGAIQLGATMDYAILVSNKYKEYRKVGDDPLQAAYKSSSSASMSVLTSASIMMCACLSVTFITSNAVIKEISLLIARGAIISCILVLCVLPSILASSERLERFIKEGGGVKGITEKFLKELNEQAAKSAKHMQERASKLVTDIKVKIKKDKPQTKQDNNTLLNECNNENNPQTTQDNNTALNEGNTLSVQDNETVGYDKDRCNNEDKNE